MYEVIEKRRILPDGTEISTYTRDVISANILEVEAGTSLPKSPRYLRARKVSRFGWIAST